MIQASDFVKQQPGRRGTKKVAKLYRLSPERAAWVEEFAEEKGVSQVEVIEAGIDTLRLAAQEAREVVQTA